MESFDLAAGEAAKERELKAHRRRHPKLIRDMERALVLAAKTKGAATIDDARAAVAVPDDVNPKSLGSVPNRPFSAGVIRDGGSVKTRRPVAHARKVTLWALVDAEAADRWLKENPPLPEADDERGDGLYQGDAA